jgi:hypothetical protein
MNEHRIASIAVRVIDQSRQARQIASQEVEDGPEARHIMTRAPRSMVGHASKHQVTRSQQHAQRQNGYV